MPSSARPCRLTSATSWSDQPSRAAARLKADALGRQSVSRRGNGTQQQVADAVVEGIAARQHDDRPAAMLLDFRQGVADRARPGERAAADQHLGQAEMALAADHQLGRREKLLRHRRQAFHAILADADDGQPARGRAAFGFSHARSHPRRHHGSLGAGQASRGRSALRGDPVVRRPHGRAQLAAHRDAHRRLRRRRRSCAIYRGAGDGGGDRRHPSLRSAHLRQRRRCLRARRRRAGLARPSRVEA